MSNTLIRANTHTITDVSLRADVCGLLESEHSGWWTDSRRCLEMVIEKEARFKGVGRRKGQGWGENW